MKSKLKIGRFNMSIEELPLVTQYLDNDWLLVKPISVGEINPQDAFYRLISLSLNNICNVKMKYKKQYYQVKIVDILKCIKTSVK